MKIVGDLRLLSGNMGKKFKIKEDNSRETFDRKSSFIRSFPNHIRAVSGLLLFEMQIMNALKLTFLSRASIANFSKL